MSNIRDDLKKAAIFLFTRKGYNGTSVREIVEKAKTTKPCLYYYFKSKEGIYLSILQETLEEFLKILSQNFGEEKLVSNQLKELCFSIYEKFKEKKDILRLIHSIFYGPPKSAPKFNFESFHKVFYETIIEKINIAIENKEFFDGDREAMAFCVMSVFNGVAEMEIAFPKKYDYKKLLDKTLSTLFEGFSRRKK